MNIKKYLDNLEDFQDKKVLVTGGTSGIGLSIVKHLLYKRAKVVVLARNQNKSNEVKNKLLEIYPDNPIEIIEYDQSSKESIIAASQEIIAKHLDFYALVMNAGIFQSKKSFTYTNDVPETINTNFIGLKILLDNLLDKLEGEHRFIFQGSLVASWHDKRIKTLQDKNLSSFQRYIISKSGVECLFYHYVNYGNPNFHFVLVEPGITNSEIIRDYPTPIRQMGHVFLKVASHSVEKAALTALKGLESTTEDNTFIVPRGLFTCMGYPKFKKFPHKRERTYLYQLLGNLEDVMGENH